MHMAEKKEAWCRTGHILVVEDATHIDYAVTQGTQRLGRYTVDTVSTREQAMAWLEGLEAKAVQPTVARLHDSLFLRKDHYFLRVRYTDILFLQADNNYTTIMTATQPFLYSMVLKKVEARLPPQSFMRVHRSYVVNIGNVTGYEGNQLLMGAHKIPVSATYRDQVFGLLEAL